MESFLTHAGYLALILFGVVEACCIPISSEITFGFAGVLAAAPGHHLNLALVIIIGSLAELAGSFIAYGIGRKGGRAGVQRFGRYVLISSRDLDRAERFFAGRGAWAVLIVRLIPVLRAFGGLASGVVEVPVAPFALFNAIGTVIFAAVLSSIGYAVGTTFSSISKDLSLASYVLVLLVVLAIAAGVLLRLREVRRERAAGTAGVADATGAGGAGGTAGSGGAAGAGGAAGLEAPAERPPPASHRRGARRR
jgi:membrane protein DedA with SNARE-associated domain